MREAINVFTAFSGYDSQCMALDRLSSLIEGFSYNLVGWSEIEPTAILAHNAVYSQYSERNYGDISKIDWSKVPDFDLFTYSFPCTDISGAGKQKGLKKVVIHVHLYYGVVKKRLLQKDPNICCLRMSKH